MKTTKGFFARACRFVVGFFGAGFEGFADRFRLLESAVGLAQLDLLSSLEDAIVSACSFPNGIRGPFSGFFEDWLL